MRPKPVVAPAPGRRIRWVWPALAAGVLLISLFAAVVFRTANGTLVFDDLHKNAVVTSDGDAITVEWPEGQGKGHARVSIPAGKHHVQVAMNGVHVTGREVTVESGKEKWFKVNYVAPSSGTGDQAGKIQAEMPPEPPDNIRPIIPPDANLFSGKYYKAFNEFLSWHQARDKCQEMGGHLAIVRNDSENRFILSLLSKTVLGSAWLGATDEEREGRWVWVDGSVLTYNKWNTNQPNNNGGRGPENYLMMERSRTRGCLERLLRRRNRPIPSRICLPMGRQRFDEPDSTRRDDHEIRIAGRQWRIKADLEQLALDDDGPDRAGHIHDGRDCVQSGEAAPHCTDHKAVFTRRARGDSRTVSNNNGCKSE